LPSGSAAMAQVSRPSLKLGHQVPMTQQKYLAKLKNFKKCYP